MKGLNGKVSDLERAAAQRKAKLDENSAFLQFNWKADVVESWIGELLGGPTLPSPASRLAPGSRRLRSLCSGFSCAEKELIMWAKSPPPGHTPGGCSRSHCPHWAVTGSLSHTGPWPGKEAGTVIAATAHSQHQCQQHCLPASREQPGLGTKWP